MTKAITHPVETLEAIAQNLNDTYEVEGLEYMGGYVIGDIVVGEISAATVSKAVGKGAGAVDDIGNIANKADNVADVAETAGKMDDVVDVARTAEKTGDVAEMAGKGLQSSFVNNIEELLVKEGVSLDEFNKLRIQDVSTLTDAEKAVLKSVRESVPMPDADTLMQKVIPASDIEKYLDGTYTQVGGYVTRAEDVVQLSTYEDIYNSLRLDYPGSVYKPLEDGSLGVIRYTTDQAPKISIPYGPEMEGTVTEVSPFTGNGFTKATNGEIIPEFKCDGYLDVLDGAQLIEISKDGVETLKAIYSKIDKKFIPVE